MIYNPCSTIHGKRAEADVPRLTATQAYSQTATLTNNLRATVEATIRAGSPDRYTLSPATLTLRPGQSAAVEVVLRVLKYAARRKATQAGQRDIFHIRVTALPLLSTSALHHIPTAQGKMHQADVVLSEGCPLGSAAGIVCGADARMFFPQATYFDQKFHATFFLAAEEAGGGGRGGASRATQAAALLRRLGPPRAPLVPLPLDANQGSHNPGIGKEGERGRVQHGPVPHTRTGLPAAAAQRSGDAGRMQAAAIAPNTSAVLLSGGSSADGRRGGDADPAIASDPSGGVGAGALAASGDRRMERLSGEAHIDNAHRTLHAAPSGTNHAGDSAAPGPEHLPQPESGSGGVWSHDRSGAHAGAPTAGAPDLGNPVVEDAAAAHRRLRETVHRQAAVMRSAFLHVIPVHGNAACCMQAFVAPKRHLFRSNTPCLVYLPGQNDSIMHQKSTSGILKRKV